MSGHFPTGLPTPSPVVDPQTGPYWTGAFDGTLVLPWCRACDRAFWYPRGFCPRCGADDVQWRAASGRGRIYTWTVVRRAGGSWAGHVPFVLACVELDEGVTVAANVVSADEDQLEIGAAVEAVFEKASADDLPALRFRPVT